MIDQCGIEEHPEECLCDVVINKITPVNVTSVSDLWGGDAICNIFDLAGPWEPDNLLQFFEKLLYGYDAHRGSTTSIRNIRPRVMERAGNETFPAYWKRIRMVIEDTYKDSPDANILDVLDMLNISVEEFRDCILFKRLTPDWDRNTLVGMQEDARASVGQNKFSRKYGLNPDKGRSGEIVYRMLGGTFCVHQYRNGDDPNSPANITEQYVRDHPSTSRDMITAWHRHTFPEVSRTARSKQISRALEKIRGES